MLVKVAVWSEGMQTSQPVVVTACVDLWTVCLPELDWSAALVVHVL
jgi:hypothetical protein